MMELAQSVTLPAPREHVWRCLNDVQVLRRCIPGCDGLELVGPEQYAVQMVAAVGPIKARFAGKLALKDVSPPHGYSIEFEGQGGIAGYGKGTARVTLADEGARTVLTYAVQAHVGGRVAQLGSRLVDAAARKLADAFFQKFTEVATAAAKSAEATAAETVAATQEPPQLPHIVIVGAGTMGVGIASVFARGGYRTAVVETNSSRREVLPGLLQEVFSGDPRNPELSLVSIHAQLSDFDWRNVELVVESVFEDLAVKQRVFAELEQVAPPGCVLASNSSSYPITEIAQSLTTASRMVNLHFFMPAHLVPGVEVVRGATTSRDSAESAASIMRRCFMVPVMVDRDLPGFLANRLQHALSREAYALMDAGVATAQAIDQAVRFCFGFRYLAAGPALQRDHSGLEIHAAAAARMYPSLATNAIPAACLEDRVRDGRLGMKTGGGFYDWDAQSASLERARYDAVLRAGLQVLAPELSAVGDGASARVELNNPALLLTR